MIIHCLERFKKTALTYKGRGSEHSTYILYFLGMGVNGQCLSEENNMNKL